MAGKKIGLYFGSFNPLTVTHWGVANSVVEETDIDQLWFVPTPESPDKEGNEDLTPFKDRMGMISIEIVHSAFAEHLLPDSEYRLQSCNIESEIEPPYYTYKTMEKIREKYGDEDEYVIVLGLDNFQYIGEWENVDKLCGEHFMVVPNHVSTLNVPDDKILEKELTYDMISSNELSEGTINEFDYPLKGAFNVSATHVRKRLAEGKSVYGMVLHGTMEMIKEGGLYNFNRKQHKNEQPKSNKTDN